jgi:hypothetical protein
MTKRRLRIPVGLFVAIVVTFVLGLVSKPLILRLTTEKQRATNVLLSAIPFILIFVAILLVYIALINMSGSLLNENISPRIYHAIERILIAAIVVGIFGIFQPWLMILYKIGFMVLLVSLLGFMWWSHIKPKSVRRQKEAGSPSSQEVKTIQP